MVQFIPTTLHKTSQPDPDEYDKGMVDVYVREWNSHFKNDPFIPRVGDFVIMPDGSYDRVAYVWPDVIQTCTGGSFYMGCGYASMSGGLKPGIPKDKFKRIEEIKTGRFWTFHHDCQQADNSIGIACGCRVFKVV